MTAAKCSPGTSSATGFVRSLYPIVLGLGGWFLGALIVLVADLVQYWTHRGYHEVPLLWRLHRMHHADLDIDVTTGVRFHPIEIGLSMLWKIVVVVPLGASPLAVLAASMASATSWI